jgi:hypothetical protein
MPCASFFRALVKESRQSRNLLRAHSLRLVFFINDHLRADNNADACSTDDDTAHAARRNYDADGNAAATANQHAATFRDSASAQRARLNDSSRQRNAAERAAANRSATGASTDHAQHAGAASRHASEPRRNNSVNRFAHNINARRNNRADNDNQRRKSGDRHNHKRRPDNARLECRRLNFRRRSRATTDGAAAHLAKLSSPHASSAISRTRRR